MSSLPLPLSPRSVVQKDGWNVIVSIHDSAYLEEKKKWRGRLAAAHPDHGGSGRKFRAAYRQYRGWLLQERRYYASLNLLPPKWTSRDETILGEGFSSNTTHERGKTLLLLTQGDDV